MDTGGWMFARGGELRCAGIYCALCYYIKIHLENEILEHSVSGAGSGSQAQGGTAKVNPEVVQLSSVTLNVTVLGAVTVSWTIWVVVTVWVSWASWTNLALLL